MVKSSSERLAIMEEKLNQNSIEHQEIKKILETFSNKLDTAIENKADKSELKTISNRMWGFVSAAATALLGIIIYLVESQFK